MPSDNFWNMISAVIIGNTLCYLVFKYML